MTNRGALKVFNVHSGVCIEDVDTSEMIFKSYLEKRIIDKIDENEEESSDDPLTDSEEGEPNAITDIQLIWNNHMYHILTVDREFIRIY